MQICLILIEHIAMDLSLLSYVFVPFFRELRNLSGVARRRSRYDIRLPPPLPPAPFVPSPESTQSARGRPTIQTLTIFDLFPSVDEQFFTAFFLPKSFSYFVRLSSVAHPFYSFLFTVTVHAVYRMWIRLIESKLKTKQTADPWMLLEVLKPTGRNSGLQSSLLL